MQRSNFYTFGFAFAVTLFCSVALALAATGLRPAQAPIWSATAGLDWTPAADWTVSVDARWESRRFDDDLNSRVLDPALTASARLERRLSPGLTAWVEGVNLFDADVETAETGTGVVSYGPPRTLWIGLSRRW